MDQQMQQQMQQMQDSMMHVIMMFAIIGGILAIFMIACYWMIFTKANKPGWASIIPIYNTIVLLEIVGRKWTRLFVYLIPIYGLICAIQDINRLSKSFGKDVGFTLGLLFLGFIFYPILAFGGAKYIGPNGQPAPTPAA